MAQVVASWQAAGEDRQNLNLNSKVAKKKLCFCSKKLDLWHFSRECCENLNIRTLRTCAVLVVGVEKYGFEFLLFAFYEI